MLGGQTQQAIAERLGWSREAVKNYSSLSKITSEAWSIVGTTIRGVGVVRTEGDVPLNGTTVPFTENLLRSILSLRPEQQIKAL